MRKFLTTGLFGAILGIVIGGAPADAALVSRGFLDEALENYATTTALDLKANQSDFTDLSDKIGTLPSGDMHITKGLGLLVPSPAYTYPTTIGDSIFQLYSGTLGLSGLADAVYHGNEFMGQTDTAYQVKGLRQITDEIGTLPSGEFPGFPGLELIPKTELPSTYPTSLAELISYIFGFSENGQPGLLAEIIGTLRIDTNDDGNPDTPIGLIPNHFIAKNAGILAEANATKIGTLPSGIFPIFPGSERLFPYLNQPFRYPTSLAELITALYGNSETGARGLLEGIIYGFPYIQYGDDRPDGYIGLITNSSLATEAKELANANTAKIGTVPDGKNLAGMISETDAKIGLLPPDTTVAGMMGNPVLLNREHTIIPLYDLILWGSNGQLVANPITGMTMPFPLLGLHDITRKVNKIGDLPTEYATVGAALTAMDAKIDARELPSTSADGQYVLSAKKVGDTITYTWVKMDLTSEEQAQ